MGIIQKFTIIFGQDKSYKHMFRFLYKILFHLPDFIPPEFKEGQEIEFRYDKNDGVVIFGTKKGLTCLSDYVLKLSKEESNVFYNNNLQKLDIVTDKSNFVNFIILDSTSDFFIENREIEFRYFEGKIDIYATQKGLKKLSDLILVFINKNKYSDHIHLEDYDLLTSESVIVTIVNVNMDKKQ